MKKLCIQFLVSLSAALLAIGIFVIVVDPCYHYHRPLLGEDMQNQVYQTPGAAEHFSYDGVIVGSSMTENFRSSWFAEEGLRNLKLSYSGARTLDLKHILDRVFQSGNTVQYVWVDLNDYQLTTEADTRFGEPPQYLYNGPGFDDVQYLYNGDVFWMSAARVWKKIAGVQSDIDAAYTWEDPELFSAEKVLAENQWEMGGLTKEEDMHAPSQPDMESHLKRCEENLDNLLPYVKAHPETEFVFYFPPYSMLYWARQADEDRMWILDVYRHSAQILLEYDNVRVFYFQNEKEIISDLNNYRDECHHSPQINRYIFECIRDGKQELTVQNVDVYFADMRQYAASFDYGELWRQ